MRILRVSLRDFRGVGAADVQFARDGVTIVEGPNEVGKSTIADAIDMLLADPDSSGKARVKAAQPVGRDVGPWAEMQFETGDYRVTYAKRWVKGPATELRVEGPSPEQLTGRAAHDRVLEILEETLDAPLFAALRHEQGMPLAQADLGASATLARALDSAAGLNAASDDDDGSLLERIDAVRLEWTTPTGSPNRARLDLREAAAAAEHDIAVAREALARQEGRIEEHRRIMREIAESEARDPDLVQARDRLAADLLAVEQREHRVAALDRDAGGAEARAREAAQRRAAREALARAVADGEQRAAAAAEDAARLDGRIADSTRSATAADEDLSRAMRAMRDAEEAHDAAAAAAQAVRDAFDVELLDERRQQVVAAEEEIAAAEEFLAGCAIDADLMERIEQAALEVAVARERTRASGARLAIEAESPQRIVQGDEDRLLAAGEEALVHLPVGEALVLPGVARIRVEGDGVAARADQQAAEQHLADLLARAGLDPAATDALDRARVLERERLDRQRRVEAARDARGRALRDLTPEEIDDKLARARTRIAAHHAGEEPPESLDAANASVAAAASARDAARTAEHAARAAHDAAAAVLRDLAARRAGVQGGIEAEATRLDADRHALAAARAEAGDDEIAREAEDLAAAAQAARARHADEFATLERDDPETVRQLADNAREAVDRAARDRTDRALEAERLLGEIGEAGEHGLADRVARAEDAAAHARDELARAERQAAAAELLHDVMTRHRDEARRAYVAPFRAEVERLARLVFGPGTSVEVDHDTLQVTTRTHDGVTVPYEALSGGAREQLAVIGRLAAATLVSADGGAPVIIDDALGYSDSARLSGVGAALAAAGARSQVIVLTCAPARYGSVGSAAVVRLEPAGAAAGGMADARDAAEDVA